ncbi:MAG: hypothetical protein QHG99_04440 [Methanomicrobiales archaeon]|nr:hypothetical protein [Methanomicrobiales archaeon]
MARVDDSGQWIVLMGIMVSIALFFLAFLLNQSTLVGMTTAESVLEFPKNEIQDLRSEVFRWAERYEDLPPSEKGNALRDISILARSRKSAEVYFKVESQVNASGYLYFPITIHYNNGVTEYHENTTYYISGE